MLSSLKRALLGLLEITYGVYAARGLSGLRPAGFCARAAAAGDHGRAGTWRTLPRRRFSDWPACRSGSWMPQHLPAGPCVVVANHASYLDGVVLKAALPARFSFVIKKEVARVPLAGLRAAADRLGVRRPLQSSRRRHGRAPPDQGRRRRARRSRSFRRARSSRSRGSANFTRARSQSQHARSCRSCRSRSAARAASCRAAGSCRAGDAFTSRCCPPLAPLPGLDPTAAIAQTRDQSRARILTALDEPDLSETDGVAELQARRRR